MTQTILHRFFETRCIISESDIVGSGIRELTSTQDDYSVNWLLHEFSSYLRTHANAYLNLAVNYVSSIIQCQKSHWQGTNAYHWRQNQFVCVVHTRHQSIMHRQPHNTSLSHRIMLTQHRQMSNYYMSWIEYRQLEVMNPVTLGYSLLITDY